MKTLFGKNKIALLAFASVLAMPVAANAGNMDERKTDQYQQSDASLNKRAHLDYQSKEMEYDKTRNAYKVRYNRPGNENETDFSSLLGYKEQAKRFTTVNGETIELKGNGIKIVSSNGNAYYAPDNFYTLENGLTFYSEDGAILRVDAPAEIVYIDADLVDMEYYKASKNKDTQHKKMKNGKYRM